MRASWLRRSLGLSLAVLVLCVLLVPAASAAEAPGANCPPVYHRIARGENLTQIAWHYGVTISQVMRWNGIVNPDRIYWGRVLVIYPSWCAAPAPRYTPPPVYAPAPVYAPPPGPPPSPCYSAPCVSQPGYAPPPNPAPAPCYSGPCAAQPAPACGVYGQATCCPDQRAAITYPYPGQHVYGMVTITGNATVDNFKFYKLEFGAGSNPSDWSYFAGGQSPVWNGALGVFNAGALSSGAYTIRVTVVDQTSNYPPPCQVTVTVN
jgi:LysM repeat protein